VYEPCGCVVPVIRRESGTENSNNIMFNHTIAKTGMLKSIFLGVMQNARRPMTKDMKPLKDI
jgi:hypothetical protein